MNLLEDWLKNLIKQPIAFLNNQYVDEGIVKAELDSLFAPLIDAHTLKQEKVKAAGHVSGTVLQKLHKKIRTQPCEEMIWGGVFSYLAGPLSVSLAHDLVDRWIATIMMGMTRQADEVQWRLATFNDDALYTLIRERYQQPEYSTAQFDTMLRQYAHTIHNESILYMLSFYETPSLEKQAALMAGIAREKRNWRKSKYVKKRLKQFIREQSQ